jgi:hypothetical protein
VPISEKQVSHISPLSSSHRLSIIHSPQQKPRNGHFRKNVRSPYQMLLCKQVRKAEAWDLATWSQRIK